VAARAARSEGGRREARREEMRHTSQAAARTEGGGCGVPLSWRERASRERVVAGSSGGGGADMLLLLLLVMMMGAGRGRRRNGAGGLSNGLWWVGRVESLRQYIIYRGASWSRW
jgi:hypothetical protein